MYAVIKTGGKQYKVAPGEKLKVEQIPADVGAEVVIDQVLMVGDGDSVRVGQPIVAGATVKATVVAPRPPRQGHDFQDAPAQALPEAPGPSPELHRAQDREHRRLTESTTMAHKKAGGSSRNGRDSESKRLGVKAYGGETDQRGQHHRPPARHAGPSGRQRRHGQGSHAVRAGRRQGGAFATKGKEQEEVRQRRRGDGGLTIGRSTGSIP